MSAGLPLPLHARASRSALLLFEAPPEPLGIEAKSIWPPFCALGAPKCTAAHSSTQHFRCPHLSPGSTAGFSQFVPHAMDGCGRRRAAPLRCIQL